MVGLRPLRGGPGPAAGRAEVPAPGRRRPASRRTSCRIPIRPRSYRRTGYRTGEILLFEPAMGVLSYLRIRTSVSGSRPLSRRDESRGTILIYVAPGGADGAGGAEW